MSAATAPKFYETKKFKEKVKLTSVTLLLIAGSTLILMPLWWMISTSLKSPAEIAHKTQAIPAAPDPGSQPFQSSNQIDST